MRIISGIRRGHKLFEFEGDDVRPTTDRVKESNFNIIQNYVPDASREVRKKQCVSIPIPLRLILYAKMPRLCALRSFARY